MFCPSNDHRKGADVPLPLIGVGGVRNFLLRVGGGRESNLCRLMQLLKFAPLSLKAH